MLTRCWNDHLNFRGRQRLKVGAVNLWTTARQLPRCLFGGVAREFKTFGESNLGLPSLELEYLWQEQTESWLRLNPDLLLCDQLHWMGRVGLEKLRKCALCTFALRSRQRPVRIPSSPGNRILSSLGTRFLGSLGTLEPNYIVLRLSNSPWVLRSSQVPGPQTRLWATAYLLSHGHKWQFSNLRSAIVS